MKINTFDAHKLLLLYGVDPSWYVFPGEKIQSGDCLVLERTAEGYRVYRFERGIESEIGTYEKEFVACSVMVASLIHDQAIVDKKLLL